MLPNQFFKLPYDVYSTSFPYVYYGNDSKSFETLIHRISGVNVASVVLFWLVNAVGEYE